ncbi:MAG: radical SAM protein [Polyangiaceae bacterium]|nr:radical SAM protein [Polyangiaceae bacterium]
MRRDAFASLTRERLLRETGRLDKQAPYTVALAYPSPYGVAMSSLGYQQIYRLIQAEPGMACERMCLPDDAGTGPLAEEPLTLEGLRPLGAFPLVALSVAYELEIAGVVQLLEASGLSALAVERGAHDPLVVAGGPLTFSNPLPLAPYVDAIVMGEADTLALEVLRTARDVRDAGGKERALAALAAVPHVFVPTHHGVELPPTARADDELLPARSAIRAPDSELGGMFLIETERGCSRGCAYCVMRRSTNGGMRIVPAERVLALVPPGTERVGLVGAAVSDHPEIVHIVRTLAERGISVGLSSLRPDRLSDDFVAALKLGGYRTLTTAMDGASERLRGLLERKARVRHLERAAELTRAHGLSRLKLYLMLGVPTETDEDVDECAAFVAELSQRIPVALAIAPFCPKRNTPLDGAPFAGIDVVTRRLARLRARLRGRADVRGTSARFAWVEWRLAQGGLAEGLAVRAAVHAGGSFGAWRKALDAAAPAAVDATRRGARRKLAVVAPRSDEPS